MLIFLAFVFSGGIIPSAAYHSSQDPALSMSVSWFYPEGHFSPFVPNRKSAFLIPSSGNFSDLKVLPLAWALVAWRFRRLKQNAIRGATEHPQGPLAISGHDPGARSLLNKTSNDSNPWLSLVKKRKP